MSVCLDIVRKAAGDDKLSQSEVDALQKLIAKKAREMKLRDAGLSDNDALLAASQEFAKNAEMKALSEKRNALLSLNARLTILDTIRNVYGADPAEGLKAALVGVQGGKRAARASAANEQLSLHNQYTGGLMSDVSRVDGGLEILSSGAMDRDIANVLWRLNTPNPDLNGLDPRAIGLGKAIHKWQEAARYNANRAGAWVGKLPGWIVTQSHDMARIGKDPEAWKAMMRERADLDRMLAESEGESIDDMLDGIWRNLASGIHLTSTPPSRGVVKGLRGMAKGLSQERSIHFKSADDWFAYNEAFGGGNLREAVLGGLDNSARATGLMRVWGPSHMDTFERVVKSITDDLQKRNPAEATKFAAKANRYGKWYMAELDGTTNIAGSNVIATWAAGARVLQNVSALGGSFLSSIGDLGVMMAGAKYAGRNGLGMVAEGIGKLFTGVPSAEKMALYADLGMALESMASKFSTNRFSVDDGMPGALGAMQKSFFKWNLQNRWTDSMRSSIAEFLSSNLARRAGDAFDALPDRLRTTLALYGIDAGKWDIVRAGTLDEIDGQRFLSPSALASVDDAKFAAYLDGKGVASGPRAVAKLREEIESQFRGYFTDQNGYMLLTPDAATRGMMKMGTQRGTPEGEAIRMVMQFKSFMLAFSQRSMGREFQQGGAMGVAGLIAWSTLAGYAAMSAKDFAKNKTPRDASDPKTTLAAMAQGGGLGIYGDILMSQIVERKGQDAAAALLGPTFSDVFSSYGLAGIASRVAEGKDPSAAAVRFAQSNAPFLNLFYTRIALDYAVFWNMQEAVNPGSLQRMEREMQKRTGQEFIISPRDHYQPEAP